MKRITSSWLTDPAAQVVCRVLTDSGHQAYFVGGCVRNDLLGAAISDIDLATDALPETVMTLAQAAGLKAVPTGIEHGTVTIISSGLACEVTTFRRDIKTDGRRAVVAYSRSMEEDARRRDFTMNALYAAPDGQVFDPLGGLVDLGTRRVRFIESATDRIREDYLRILRFFRFHAWYGAPEMGLDPDGLAAVSGNSAGIDTLSRERVGYEALKLLAAPDPAPSVAAMEQAGVLARVLPGASAAPLAPLVHLEGESSTEADPIRRLACLGGGAGVKDSLRLSRKDLRRLSLLTNGMSGTEGAAELSYRHGADLARDMVLLRSAILSAPLPENMLAELAEGSAARFPVKAGDLAGSYAGAALGEQLRRLESRWVASGFRLTRAELLA